MSTCQPIDPQPVLPAGQAWPLFSVALSRAIESRELAARPGGLLMRNAGHAVARLGLALAPHARRVWVAAGPGGNGGDGLHAAANLQQAGREVFVTLLATRERLPPDALLGLQRAERAGVHVSEALPQGSFDLVIDALLGIGALRPPAGDIAAAIAALNCDGAPCLAVDLPSGLNADTGMPLGDTVVRADATLSLLTLKPGLFTAAGREYARAIWFDALGVDLSIHGAPSAHLTSAGDWRSATTRRRHDQHKGSFGDVVVVGGAPGMLGAARLAAHAALTAGAGRTILSLLDLQATHADATRPEWLWCRGAWLPGVCALEQSTVVCGCGGGSEVRGALPALLSRSARLVLDADALNALAVDPALRSLLLARATRGLATVLTPHPLEAARLLQSDTAAVQGDRLAAADELARRFGSIIVLKGSGTVIASPGRTPAVNSTGHAGLASGGTGDVLAGWIGGQWAQRAANTTSSAAADDAFRCAVASVWLHGRAADLAPSSPVRARDLVEAMRDIAASTLLLGA